MEFGLFMELSVPRPWTPDSERQVYENALEQVRLADELGFDYVWAVEHHFLEEYSHCSAPDLFLAAARRCRPSGSGSATASSRACRSTRARSGWPSGRRSSTSSRAGAWSWAPAAPRRGPSSAGSAPTPTRPRRRGTSSSGSSRRCGRRSASAWDGRMFSMPERAMLPKPMQKPHPPMWVAVTSPGTELDAADRGLGCLGLSPGGFADSEKKVKTYRAPDSELRPGRRLRQRQGADRQLPLLLRGRRPGPSQRPQGGVASSATWRRSCCRPRRCCRRTPIRPRACCRRCGGSRAVRATPPRPSRA